MECLDQRADFGSFYRSCGFRNVSNGRHSSGRLFLSLRENLAFFAQRISGFAMLLFILVHLLIFYVKDSPKFVLHDFGVQQLTVSILLVACLVVHLVFGIRQLLISLGIRSFSEILADVLFVVSVVLLLSAIGFLIYFYRWNLAWRP